MASIRISNPVVARTAAVQTLTPSATFVDPRATETPTDITSTPTGSAPLVLVPPEARFPARRTVCPLKPLEDSWLHHHQHV
jgi:hypothetical protein